jgi:SAM-dependent methyltransferase
MPRIDSEKFYISALKKHGISSRGLNWFSDTNQSLRFSKILELLDEEMESAIIADAGCGFGDFYFYLQANSIFPKKYIGIDSLSEMCTIAKTKTNSTILNLDITKEVLPVADYYICSGALNVLTEFETHLFIQNCYKASKKAFVFNALFGDYTSETYNYLTKEKINQIAKNLRVKEVTFLEGYIDHDITVRFAR